MSFLTDNFGSGIAQKEAMDAGYTYKPVVLDGVSYMPGDREAYKKAYQAKYGNEATVPNPWYDAEQTKTDSMGRAKSLLDPQANQPTGGKYTPRKFGELNYSDKELWSKDTGLLDFLKGWLEVPATGMILGMGGLALSGGSLIKSLANFAQDPVGAVQSVISSGGQGLTTEQLAQMAEEATQLGMTQQAAELASLGGGAAGAVIPELGAASTGGLTNGINLLGTSGAAGATGAAAGGGSGLASLATSLGIPTAGTTATGLLATVAAKLGTSPSVLSSLIAGGASVAGGLLANSAGADAADAAGDAAKVQSKASDAQIAFQKEELEKTRANLKPFLDAGTQQLPGLSSSVSNLSDLTNDPNKQVEFINNNPFFKLLADDAQSRLFANQAAKGKVGSGGTAQALQNSILLLGQDLLNQDVARKNTSIGNQYNLAKLGENAAAMTGDASQNTANSISDLATGSANARAAGIVGASNAKTSALNSGINTALGIGSLAYNYLNL